jgi:hypothetical protein
VRIRAAGIIGVVVVLSACGGPAKSPLVLWWDTDPLYRPIGGIRTGMPLDSLERFWVLRDGLTPDAQVWDRCTPVDAGAQRCERRTVAPAGHFTMVAAADGRVVYMAYAPEIRDIVFDDSLTWMQRDWILKRGARLDPRGVTEENPHGVAEMRIGRWRGFNTFDGKQCENTIHPRPCPSLIQLVDWRDGRQYADTIGPQ